MASRAGACVRILLAALIAVPSMLEAQDRTTSLTVSGFPLTVASTTGSDFDAGFVLLGSTTFSVASVKRGGFNSRSTTVEVQCVAACPQSGLASVSGLQWRRADQVTWTNLTTGYVTVEQRILAVGGANDPWTQTMQWRYLLNWTGSPPAASTEFRIRFQLLVTAP